MCGIVAYIGKKNAKDVLLNGLYDLEYRGYDSAGIKLGGNEAVRSVGEVKNLEEQINPNTSASVGIAHTRWATHGPPSKKNAHPHTGRAKRIWLVHNGIIENHKALKEELKMSGIVCVSDTDSEVLAQIIEQEYQKNVPLEEALHTALLRVHGTFGIAVYADDEPDMVLVARMGSPLVIGVGKGEHIIASDVTPIIKHTKNVVYLEDGEIGVIRSDSYEIKNIRQEKVEKEQNTIDWDITYAQKEGFEHFMLKEIHEIPRVIENTMRGRIVTGNINVKLGGLECVEEKLKGIEHIYIIGCGSAYYAGLYGKYLMEAFSGISAEVDIASEFRYRNPVFRKNAAVLVISQSGETADTLEAVRIAKQKGILSLGIVNVVDSSIARETDAGIYNHAGPEISVASTKAFISQLTALVMVALFFGKLHKVISGTSVDVINELLVLPKKVEMILKQSDEIKMLAVKYAKHKDFLFIGRTYNFPIALEGALKLKEVSYIHAEGYSAGELKHGPIALIDTHIPVVAIAPSGSVAEKMQSNIEEIRARGGEVLLVSDEKEAMFPIPKTIEPLQPLLTVIPLQLFAYHVSVAKGLNVDRPRNLAKSVTVE